MTSSTISVSTTEGVSVSITTTETERESSSDNISSSNSEKNEQEIDKSRDGQIENLPVDSQNVTYTIAVKTSDKFWAGTDANVFMQLINDQYSSQIIPLKQSINHRTKFVRNQSDVFVFQNFRSIGNIQRIKIWHDNTGPHASWHLKTVEIHDSYSNLVYSFPCNEWLSKKKEKGGQLCRILECKGIRLKLPKLFHFNGVPTDRIPKECTTVHPQFNPIVQPQRTPQLHQSPLSNFSVTNQEFDSTFCVNFPSHEIFDSYHRKTWTGYNMIDSWSWSWN